MVVRKRRGLIGKPEKLNTENGRKRRFLEARGFGRGGQRSPSLRSGRTLLHQEKIGFRGDVTNWETFGAVREYWHPRGELKLGRMLPQERDDEVKRLSHLEDGNREHV